MMRLQALVRDAARVHPLRIATLIQFIVFGLFVWSLAAYGTTDVTGGTGQPEVSYILDAMGTEVVAAVLLMSVIAILGWGIPAHMTTRLDWAGVKWAAPIVGIILFFIVAMVILLITEGMAPERTTVIWKLAVFCLAVGVFEEGLYRGTLYYGLSKHFSPFWAMMVSSAVFGLFHMQNLAVGQALDATAFQSLNAFALGVLFCAIMLQTNSIWWAVMLHAVWNLFLLISAYAAQSEPELVGITPEDLANQSSEITATAFLLPVFLISLGLFIFARWSKRMRLATLRT